MSISRRIREQMLALCGSIGEEDGLSRKEAKKLTGASSSRNQPGDQHRQLRLCKQISHTLSLFVQGLPLAYDVRVTDVVPGQQMSYVVVRICCSDASNANSKQEILRELGEIEGWLRVEIARAITRKRVPRLRFEVVPQTDEYNLGQEVSDG